MRAVALLHAQSACTSLLRLPILSPEAIQNVISLLKRIGVHLQAHRVLKFLARAPAVLSNLVVGLFTGGCVVGVGIICCKQEGRGIVPVCGVV